MKNHYYVLNDNLYDFTDKEKSVNNHIKYMLNRTQSMFKYENLPSTIPQRMLEIYLQKNGSCGIAQVDGNLYALIGGLGGEPDAYYMPTLYTVANPFLKLSKNYKIGDDIVVIPNDSMYMGLMPLFSRYASAMVENELSMNLVDINSRIISLISASDDRTKASAELYLKNISDGKLGVIGETALLDGVKSQPYAGSNNNIMTSLIEYEQYLKASLFNEIGLNANYNMKRESINSGEAQLNDDMLMPLIDNMLEMRKIGVEAVNDMFGTDISVEFSSAWEDNVRELDAELEMLDNATDNSDEVEQEGGADDEET